MTDPRSEILMGLPSQPEIAAALNSIKPGPHHETVRRMATALDLLRSGGWKFVKAPGPKALDVRPRAIEEQ